MILIEMDINFTFHKKPISSAVYNALMSLCVDILQNGKFRFFEAFSSSAPSPMTTYVLFRPNLVTILSKHDSLPIFGDEKNYKHLKFKIQFS